VETPSRHRRTERKTHGSAKLGRSTFQMSVKLKLLMFQFRTASVDILYHLFFAILEIKSFPAFGRG